jgi:hypothetical protein
MKAQQMTPETMQKHDKLIELLSHYHSVPTKHSDDYEDKLCWCLEHCEGKFRDMIRNDVRYWYFEKENDATLFALKYA